MIRDFVAIDFETANQQPCSVCSVGIVIVKDGEVADSFYSLIQPEPNYYSYWCQQVHGLCQKDTDDAPIFPKVWEEIEQRIATIFPDKSHIPFVAHNARFDEGCLKAVFKVYQLDYPDYFFFQGLSIRLSRLLLLRYPKSCPQTVWPLPTQPPVAHRCCCLWL